MVSHSGTATGGGGTWPSDCSRWSRRGSACGDGRGSRPRRRWQACRRRLRSGSRSGQADGRAYRQPQGGRVFVRSGGRQARSGLRPASQANATAPANATSTNAAMPSCPSSTRPMLARRSRTVGQHTAATMPASGRAVDGGRRRSSMNVSTAPVARPEKTPSVRPSTAPAIVDPTESPTSGPTPSVGVVSQPNIAPSTLPTTTPVIGPATSHHGSGAFRRDSLTRRTLVSAPAMRRALLLRGQRDRQLGGGSGPPLCPRHYRNADWCDCP